MRNANEGTIRVGMIDIAAVNYFQGVLKDFRIEHPSLNFHLNVSPSRPLIDALQRGQLDLVVCIEPDYEIKGIQIEPLLTETLSIYKPEEDRWVHQINGVPGFSFLKAQIFER